MIIHWVNGQYPEDQRVFDSQVEVYEWTHSLYPDFSNCLFREASVGYATPDEKVIEYLSELIPKWADYLNVRVTLHTDKVLEDSEYIYRIWTTQG